MTTELLGRVIAAYDIPGPEAERRVGLVAAHLLGVFTGRYLMELPAIARPTRAELVAAVGPVLQRYLDGDFERPDDDRRSCSDTVTRGPDTAESDACLIVPATCTGSFGQP